MEGRNWRVFGLFFWCFYGGGGFGKKGVSHAEGGRGLVERIFGRVGRETISDRPRVPSLGIGSCSFLGLF